MLDDGQRRINSCIACFRARTCTPCMSSTKRLLGTAYHPCSISTASLGPGYNPTSMLDAPRDFTELSE